jgi:hypothetical protein
LAAALVGLAACDMSAMMQPRLQLTPTMRDNAMNWCVHSPEPNRCRARSAAEHQICMGVTPERYPGCRFAMDQMHPY